MHTQTCFDVFYLWPTSIARSSRLRGSLEGSLRVLSHSLDMKKLTLKLLHDLLSPRGFSLMVRRYLTKGVGEGKTSMDH